MAFSHETFREIVTGLRAYNRPIVGVGEFFGQKPTVLCTILRHDVDHLSGPAEKLARLENQLGIRSTYYFRARQGRFDKSAILEIADLGHEVGYHYETLSQCGGHRQSALELFRTNLETFRKIAPCVTVSMHGAPLSPHNNLDLLAGEDLERYGLLADAVLSFQGKSVWYFTDTGGTWNANPRKNRRDRIPDTAPPPANFVPDGSPKCLETLQQYSTHLYLNTHPERWAWNLPTRIRAEFFDGATNLAKQLIALATTGAALVRR